MNGSLQPRERRRGRGARTASSFSTALCRLSSRRLAIAALTIALAGCAVQERDYSALIASNPRSILVVPVLNETTTIEAPEVVEAIITRPLAERGYYVFPLILTDALFKDLGLSEAGHVQELPPQRFHELFGADAVLFVVVTDWGSKYLIVDAATVVALDFTLRDTRTGTVLWTSSQRVQYSSGAGGGDPIGALIAAAVGYVLNEAIEPDYRPLATQAVRQAFYTPGRGLPAGPYSPQHGSDLDRYAAP